MDLKSTAKWTQTVNGSCPVGGAPTRETVLAHAAGPPIARRATMRLLSGPMRLLGRVSLVVIILGCVVALAGCGSQPGARGTCEDVTSHDYNWDNDMKCTRSDGSVF